mgnify:CR=1 FL=1
MRVVVRAMTVLSLPADAFLLLGLALAFLFGCGFVAGRVAR